MRLGTPGFVPSLGRLAFIVVAAFATACGSTQAPPPDSADAPPVTDATAQELSVAELEDCRCSSVLAPVCGSDGVTYRNACRASCRGARVEHDGVCCRCPEGGRPVCGADGDTYENACRARCAGVEFRAGPCPPPPSRCASNADCEGDLVCRDRRCAPPCRIACLKRDPVCGADNRTYACGAEDAACHGVEVAYDGPCRATCLGPDDCDDGERCARENLCLPPPGCRPDAPCPAVCAGLCQPCGCTNAVAPVCGADGETYRNRCLARCAGVDVVAPGACEPACDSNDDCRRGLVCIADRCRPPCVVNCLVPDPVCGTDGQTYVCGERDAACHGVDVAHPGSCRRRCLEDEDCRRGQTCSRDPRCLGPPASDTSPGGCPGVCEPCACPDIYKPVCGADGQTYGNACEARCAHVEVASEGACRKGCGCNDDCDRGEVCRDGSCGPACQIACLVPDPVCGEDGRTYVCGRADAACHGVEVAYRGRCQKPCTSGRDCGPGARCNAEQICLPPPQCGGCDRCPDVCTGYCEDCGCADDPLSPVCGADGRTWPNACLARCAGVEVEHPGQCGRRCRDDGDCPAGTRCDDGRCEPCNCPAVAAPVCGADGETYINRCAAECARVDIVGPGPCERECRRDVDCPEGELCRNGRCETCVCPDIYAPVCGVDGETYGNACEARCAHVAIARPGECPRRCEEPGDCPPGFRCDAGGCLPCICPDIFAPVCGADGQTYSNACYARCAAVDIAHPGPCGEPCSCNAECRDGNVCRDGQCGPRCQIACLVPDPVCGSDGRTYVCGEADAACHGAEVLYRGECQPSCVSDNDCRSGRCNAEELCLPHPECFNCGPCPRVCTGYCEGCDCPDVYAPVCDADGHTWPNRCEARCAGVTDVRPGPCPERCECNDDCADGEVCWDGECGPRCEALCLPDSEVCGANGRTYACAGAATCHGVAVLHDGACREICETDDDCERGTCEAVAGCPVPDACGGCASFCTPGCRCNADCGDREICRDGACEPRCVVRCAADSEVCGADGETYHCAGEAHCAGVEVLYDGACRDTCTDDADCEAGQLCQSFEPCETPDACGGCASFCSPCACPRIYDPVCGVDGVTYSNACVARCAHVEIAHEGECRRPCDCNDDCDGEEEVCLEGECSPRCHVRCLPNSEVCGADGQTWSCAAAAQCAGVRVLHPGPCAPRCETNDDCDPGRSCQPHPGCALDSATGAASCHCASFCAPCFCPQIFAPVCGADGETYSNACEARCAGVEIVHEGECLRCTVEEVEVDGECVPKCYGDDGCPPDLACNAAEVCLSDPACPECDVCVGWCVPRDDCICPDVWDPVCGVDGETYGNACEARCAGVEIAYHGECRPCGPDEQLVNGVCVPLCYGDQDCRDGNRCNAPEVCLPDPSCPICAVCTGWCVPTCRCPDDGVPVCGADGVTYPSHCAAACANVPVLHPGPCQDQCHGDPDCEPGEVCELILCPGCVPGAECPPCLGQCQPCACPEIYDPVCGVDGQTYGNACEARCAHVEIAYEGECRPGCTGDDDCPTQQICREDFPCLPPCVEGPNGDVSCAPCPGRCVDCGCPDVWAPVCGEDGETYGNACEARCAHVEVAHPGPCDACICPAVFDPVCGVDGQTYGNACEARCAGVEIAYEGECRDRECHCNADCENSAADAPQVCRDGQCQPACAISCLVYDPVCGADGVTYGCGEVDAACHGVPVLHEGECPATCDDDAACDVGEVCQSPPQCPLPDSCGGCPGFCRDCICPDVWDPVCGVDGQTYGNPCEARCAHVEVAHPGACLPPGCEGDADCPPGEICERPGPCPLGPCIQHPDGSVECPPCPGACQPCFCPAVFDPVCGADGQTYGNACEARCAHVDVVSEGPCAQECQCNSDCAADAGEICRDGNCSPRCAVSCLVPDPVCGSDGQTYVCGDADAACAGVEVLHRGPCARVCDSNDECDAGSVCAPVNRCPSECGCASFCEPCLCPDLFAPVCGADGQTYDNPCRAQCARVVILHPGACR